MTVIRSSRSFLFDLVRAENSRLNTEMHRLTEQAVTGRKINRPSDSPTEIGRVVRIREELSNQETFQQNIGWSQSLIGTADTVMGEASNLLKRAHELAVGMANANYSATDRAAAGIEIESLREELIRLSNTELGDRFIFAGDAYSDAAFDTTGTYLGSTGTPEILIGDDVYVQSGWDGSEVFQGNVDVFAVLDDLATALNSNDDAQVFALIDDVELGVEQMIEGRQSIGWAYAKTEDYLVLAEKMQAELTQNLGSLVDADSAEVYMQLQEAQSAYEAAIQVASSGMNLSLFNSL